MLLLAPGTMVLLPSCMIGGLWEAAGLMLCIQMSGTTHPKIPLPSALEKLLMFLWTENFHVFQSRKWEAQKCLHLAQPHSE